MLVHLYPDWEAILADLADLFDFQFVKVATLQNSVGTY